MAWDIAIVDADKEFAAIAADRMKAAADMSLHELVDEFVRLNAVVSENLISSDLDDGSDFAPTPRLNAIGMIADAERRVINGAARARFSLHLSHRRMLSEHA